MPHALKSIGTTLIEAAPAPRPQAAYRAGVSHSALEKTMYGMRPSLSKPYLTKSAEAMLRSSSTRRMGSRICAAVAGRWIAGGHAA